MESYVKGKIPQIIFGSKSAQNVIKALSVEGIHCDVFDRFTWK